MSNKTDMSIRTFTFQINNKFCKWSTLQRQEGGHDDTYNRERFRLYNTVILLSEAPSSDKFLYLLRAINYMLYHGWFEYEENKLPVEL